MTQIHPRENEDRPLQNDDNYKSEEVYYQAFQHLNITKYEQEFSTCRRIKIDPKSNNNELLQKEEKPKDKF